MKMQISSQLRYTYFACCLSATIILSIYSIFRYISNEDTTKLKINKFLSSKDAMYPSFSFCILDPFVTENFADYNDEQINLTSYKKFLKGEIWDARMLKVEYDNVTVSLSENLIQAKYETHSEIIANWNVEHFVSFRSPDIKCFTIKAPHLDEGLLLGLWIQIENNIFPDGKRSVLHKISTNFHYSGQRFTSLYTTKVDFDFKKNTTNNYRMQFSVRNVDVITRRNKKQEPCVKEWKNYDVYYLQYWMNEIGCRPPHWKSQNDNFLPVCSSSNEMKNFSRNLHIIQSIQSIKPPCKVIDRLDYIFEENDLDDNG